MFDIAYLYLMNLGDETVELKVGDCWAVPKDVQHRPVSDVESGILIVEKVGTVNTGDREGDEKTVYVDESKGMKP